MLVNNLQTFIMTFAMKEIDYNEFLQMMEKVSIIPIKMDEAQPVK